MQRIQGGLVPSLVLGDPVRVLEGGSTYTSRLLAGSEQTVRLVYGDYDESIRPTAIVEIEHGGWTFYRYDLEVLA